ncbi:MULTISPECIES: hypothetical protein [unclassified Methylocaldum]|jgi:hypothetical protein|uniref:hypothetical protein n=1 Tax=unclassified Methylocaldum TaxID=2622260 RepID=UPI0012ECA140|nr:hypothetical protein [Methylocaldum sp. RMAD-M]MBP1151837.1 hypothetical protein [Methylocaldum sp. RMAD-M]MVF23938.1 hypothetical protein [Methylocaldum sp. BRCS4]
MAEQDRGIPPILTPEAGEADISTKALIAAVIIFLVVVIVASAGAWLLIKRWAHIEPTPALPPSPQPTVQTEPPLQIAPALDLQTLRQREDRLLRSTEWIDQGAGIARIPIEDAMALLVKRARRDNEPRRNRPGD